MAPFPGSTAAAFYKPFDYFCYEYLGEPLAWIMPLGSMAAALLGCWVAAVKLGPATWFLSSFGQRFNKVLVRGVIP